MWTYFVYSGNVLIHKINYKKLNQIFFVYGSYSQIWELFPLVEARAQYSFKTQLLPSLSEEFPLLARSGSGSKKRTGGGVSSAKHE